MPARRHRGRRGLGGVLERVLHEVVVHLKTTAYVIVDAGDSLESHMVVAIKTRNVVARTREPDALETEFFRALLHELEFRTPQPLAAGILDEIELAEI